MPTRSTLAVAASDHRPTMAPRGAMPGCERGAAMTIARSNWRWMLPAVLVALAGLGWFLFGEFKKPPPPTAPATQLPAVGVRPAVMKRGQSILRIRRTDQSRGNGRDT